MLYICTKFCQSISKVFIVTDPNSRVDTRVVANVDGQTYGLAYKGMENWIPISWHDCFIFVPSFAKVFQKISQ